VKSFLLGIALLVPAMAQAQEERWTFALTPYLWLPNVNGTLKYEPTAGGGAPAVDNGPNNYLENLSMALMLSGEARKGRWSVISDLIYLRFDSEKSNVSSIDFGGSRVDANADIGTKSSLKGLEWTIAASYAALQSPDWQLTGPIGSFPASGSVSRSTDLWDPIVGVRGRVRWGEGAWFSPYYLDVGTGSSELTWQSLVGIGYGFKWGDLVLAYRTLFYDQSDDKLLQDFRFSGATLGASFRF
jgi:hypothetical protein